MKNNAERQFTAEEALRRGFAPAPGKARSTALSRVFATRERSDVSRAAGERGAYYQAMTGEPCLRHLHLKCLSCGLLIHLDENESRRIASVALGRIFTVDGKKTMLFGYCGSCADGAGKESV